MTAPNPEIKIPENKTSLIFSPVCWEIIIKASAWSVLNPEIWISWLNTKKESPLIITPSDVAITATQVFIEAPLSMNNEYPVVKITIKIVEIIGEKPLKIIGSNKPTMA